MLFLAFCAIVGSIIFGIGLEKFLKELSGGSVYSIIFVMAMVGLILVVATRLGILFSEDIEKTQ